MPSSNIPAANDDLYVQDGETYQNGIYYPEAPQAQRAALDTEQSVKSSSYPILPDIYAWFQKQIDECPNITNIQMTTMTINGVKYERKVSIEGQALAYQLLQTLLIEKQHEFEAFAEAKS